ncbi:zinc dependent phospholipase C family protein [Paenibacillus arenilitoris]|uniref:Zinc dependent phospholipase C family protein n=1 Tax=Paenibacillus arenilitoris TaxID=2772299 RepID=A0A927CRV4_9BACL|nr:zinc dependent phospholipase C family protein [Paenibacillus arenilitoris]MBD2872017.1 zinc dependent phospholipase C family protein [Paenibacillus arenilitoris]
MPNVWAHLIFGQLVLEQIGEASMLRTDEQKNMFNLGCQGPDFLFYDRFLPWQKSAALNRMGTEMHNRHCGPALVEMLDCVGGRRACPKDPDPSVLYALGFVLHHILDRNMHPYVFSKSGFRKWDHQRFEIMMDTLVARQLWGIETWKTAVWKHIDTNGAFPAPVIDAFESVTEAYYSELAPLISREDWNRANRDFTAAQRLFHDPTGLRRKLTFGRIEPFVYKRGVIPYDVMNDSEQPWIDPVDSGAYRRESAWTLWDRAVDDAAEVIRSVLVWLRAYENPQPTKEDRTGVRLLREQAAGLIGNRSYETGLDCDSGARIRYADTIWPDQPGMTEAPSE